LLADGCAESRETVVQRPRTIPQEIWRDVSLHFRTISRQWPDSGKHNAAEFPRGNLQDNSQYAAQWPRNVRATDNATSRETSRKMTRRNFLIAFLTMTLKNYEHITINA
jgi:hypothetical protein